MDHSPGQGQTAIFAAGPARQRIVRVAVAGGIALLVAWLAALVLGVFGGFESLPLLPDNSHQSNASRVSPADRSAHAAAASPDRDPAAKAQTLAARSGGTTTVAPRRSTVTPKVKAPPTQQAASTTVVATSQGHGQGLTRSTTQGSGKPSGSPGNGTGGSGAPGQLR